MEYATFYIGENVFGLPIMQVQEIATVPPIHQIPGHDHRIAGLLNLRGRAAVAIDLAQCLFVKKPEPRFGARKKIIILATLDVLPQEARELGLEAPHDPTVLLVDDMFRIVDGDRETYHETPANVIDACVDGVLKTEGSLITLLSLSRLLRILTPSTQGAV